MEIYYVQRPNDWVLVTIMKNKNDNTYSYINLTKKHICPCRFKSIEDALDDMNKKIKTGEVISYFKADWSDGLERYFELCAEQYC